MTGASLQRQRQALVPAMGVFPGQKCLEPWFYLPLLLLFLIHEYRF